MIIKLNKLNLIRNKFKGKKIVFAGGTFDLFHPTHIKAINNLRKYGDIIVIGIVSDKRVIERKGITRPILSQKERAEIVDALRYVDYTVIMPNQNKKTPFPTMSIINKLNPNVFVSVDRKWIEYIKIFNDLGIKLKIVKRINKTSTTSIIKRVLSKNI